MQMVRILAWQFGPRPAVEYREADLLALFNALLVTGPGVMAEVPELSYRVVQLPGFSTAANSKVPHNALHDARALRDHILSME